MRKSIVVVFLSLLLASCGSSSPDQGGNSKPEQTSVPWASELTNPVDTKATHDANNGGALALEQSADSSPRVKLDFVDSTAQPTRIVAVWSRLAKSDASIAMLGTYGTTAIVAAPIIDAAKLPVVLDEAGGPSVLNRSKYFYRTTAQQADTYKVLGDYFAHTNIKKIVQLYDSDVPTTKQMGEETWPAFAKEHGFDITKYPLSVAATDFSTVIRQAINQHPDVMLLTVGGQQNANLVAALRNAGYTGLIAGQNSQLLTGADKLPDKGGRILNVTDFTPLLPGKKIADFVAAYRKKFGDDPTAFAAHGYDAATFVQEVIKSAHGNSRADMFAAMQQVAKRGFDGLLGHVTFNGQQATSPAVIIDWNRGHQSLLSTS
jgi:branched-chain amino acid transport system substrate-binding protein